MESEGPYKFKDRLKYAATVGPGIPDGEEYFDLPPEVANMIYAEGRKSMEKDFNELLRLADGMRSWCNVKEKWAMIWGRQFDDWKKARGVE